MWGLSSRVPRRILSYRMLSVFSRKCYGWCDSRPSIQKLEFRYGQVQYVCFHETRTSKVWDSYVIIMELKIIFQIQTKAKRYEISKAVFVLQTISKRCLLCIWPITEGSSRTPVIWWRWIKQQLKGYVRRVLVWLTHLGSPGLTPLLSWMLLLRVGEILEVKLLEV